MFEKEIRHIAAVGTDVIGTSWGNFVFTKGIPGNRYRNCKGCRIKIKKRNT